MEFKANDFKQGREKMSNLLKNAKGELFDICAEAFRLISNSKNQEIMFRYFLEEGADIESSESLEVEAYFTASMIQALKRSCEDLVDGILNKLVCMNLSEEEFYKNLWLSIGNNTIFSNKEEQMYALYSIYIDCRVPYFQLENGIKMSDDEFASITENMQNDIKKVRFILSTKLEQRTERASLLIKILNSYKTLESQSVMLAHILSIEEQISCIPQSIIEEIISK